MSEEILINVTPRETRVGVVENGMLQEVHVERASRRGYVGNIYKGRVQRVMPGMQAAFVEIGLERAAFLHASDIVRPALSAVEDDDAGSTDDDVDHRKIGECLADCRPLGHVGDATFHCQPLGSQLRRALEHRGFDIERNDRIALPPEELDRRKTDALRAARDNRRLLLHVPDLLLEPAGRLRTSFGLGWILKPG